MAFDELFYTLRYMQFEKLNSNGYAAGIVDDPDSVSVVGGAVLSGALVIDNPIAFPAPDVTRTIVTEKGGGGILQKIDAGVSDISEVELQITRLNSVLNKASTGVGSNTAEWSHAELGGADFAAQTLKNMSLIYFTRTSNKDSSGFHPGQYAAFETHGTLSIKPIDANQNDGENPMAITGIWAPTKISKLGNGRSLSSLTGLNYSDGETMIFPYNKMSAFFHRVTIWLPTAASGVTVTLPYLPLSNAVALGGANWITLNGVPSATIVASISTSTGVVAIATSGYSAGDLVHIVYPTNRVASA